MNNLDRQYQDLLQDILDNGVRKEDRTGTGTLSVFGRQIRHKMSEGFPLLTTKKMAFNSIVIELLWFLKGRTDLRYLLDNDCYIWVGDAYKRYVTHWGDPIEPVNFELYTRLDLHPDKRLFTKEEFINKIKTDDEFANTWGSLGKIYGFQWRNWNGKIDQISELIKQLKENADSRRLIVNAWAVDDLSEMVLPPCHYGFQVYTRELSLEERNYSLGPEDAYLGIFGMNEKYDLEYKELFDKENRPTRAISLMFNMRSVDTFLGLPFNIASYGLLLEIIAREVNMVPDELIGNLGDTHLYLNHIEQAKEQISREPFDLPKLKFNRTFDNMDFNSIINDLTISDFIIENYQSHPTIKAPLSN